MARSPIPIVVFSPTGAPVPGASVQIQKRGTSINSTVYADDSTMATIANPVITDAFGRAMGWLDRGAYQATVSKVGMSTRTEFFDISPGTDGAVETAWLGDGQVTKTKQAADTVPNIQVFNASGTYTKPSGAKMLLVTVIGGGGGGNSIAGAAPTDGSYVPGGGPGVMIQAQIAAAEVGASVAVTVGNGGSGGTSSAGSAGTSSRFGNIVTAAPGPGGNGIPSTTLPGTGGTITTGGNASSESGIASIFGQSGGAAAASSSNQGTVGGSGVSGTPGGGGGSGFRGSPGTTGGNGGVGGGGGGSAVYGKKAGDGGIGLVVVVTI